MVFKIKNFFLFNILTGFLLAQTPPDIVVVLADDHGVYDASPYGANEIQTPNMQALATEGIKFTRAYVASPACAPSRAALFSGQMPYNNGIVGNHETSYKPSAPILLTNLIDLGYEIVFKGKIAHGNQSNAPYVPPEVNVLSGGAKPLNLTNVEDFLKNRNANSKPLALFIGPKDTHLQWPNPSTARINSQDIVIPPKSFDTPETRTVLRGYVESVENVDRTLGQVRGFISTYLDPQNTILIYTSDHGKAWPFGKWSLYETGIRTPFLAVWPGKIQPNSITNAMVSWIDLMPTLIDIAGGSPPSSIDGRSFKQVLFGLTNTHHQRIFATHKGDNDQNVYPIRSVRTEKWKFIFNLRPELYYTTHIDRANRHANFDSWDDFANTNQEAAQLMIDYRSRPVEELYDVENDPFEMINLAFDPRYKNILDSLRVVVQNHMQQVNDDESLSGTPLLLSNYSLPAAIKIFYPNGGEHILTGSNVEIVWNANWKGTSTVSLDYFDGNNWNVISSSAPHSGSYIWNTAGINLQNVKIRIASSDGTILDESDNNFSITDVMGVQRKPGNEIFKSIQLKNDYIFTGNFNHIHLLKIVSTAGSELKTIDIKNSPDLVSWDGTNNSGKPLDVGIYFAMLYSKTKNGITLVHKLSFLKN